MGRWGRLRGRGVSLAAGREREERLTQEVEREVVGEGEVRGGELAHVFAGGGVGEEVRCERRAGDSGSGQRGRACWRPGDLPVGEVDAVVDAGDGVDDEAALADLPA